MSDDINFLKDVALPLALGGVAWWVAHWVAHPIMAINQLRQEIHEEFFYTANVGWSSTSDAESNRLAETQSSIRRLAAKISALNVIWPCHLRWYLKYRRLDLNKAANNLTGLSNSVFYTDRNTRHLRAVYKTTVEKALKLPLSYSEETMSNFKELARKNENDD